MLKPVCLFSVLSRILQQSLSAVLSVHCYPLSNLNLQSVDPVRRVDLKSFRPRIAVIQSTIHERKPNRGPEFLDGLRESLAGCCACSSCRSTLIGVFARPVISCVLAILLIGSTAVIFRFKSKFNCVYRRPSLSNRPINRPH